MNSIILVPDREPEVPLVTNIGANGNYMAGFLAAITLVVVLLDKVPSLLKFVRARRQLREADATPLDQLRTHSGGKTIHEIERDAELRGTVEVIERDLGGAFKKIESLLEWRTLVMATLGKMPEESDIKALSSKIDDLRKHIDELDGHYRQRIEDHVRDYHRPGAQG